MDSENSAASQRPSIGQRLLPAVIPVLLTAIGYIDPGKWVATVEGGARFGSDLVLLMLVFNFAAILCQYLSARIALVTGRDLSQICCEEYDKSTCRFLGVLAEVSMIALDLTVILGTAHGLNLLLGVDLFTCVFLTAIEAILSPVFANLLDNGKAKFLCISMASFILLFYILGVLFSQPEISISTNGMLTKLSGETSFVLMSLLGSNITPHHFYLHSSIIQQELRTQNISKGLLCHDHFFAILCIFSGIFLVNYVLMNAAANLFYSTGLVLLTFQDALSLMDQVFRSSTVPLAVLLVLIVSSQITTLTRNLGRQAVLYDFFGMDFPGWLHHATIRIIAILTALYCVWNSGAEGTYQLLILTQVAVALLLPSSVIPLFRVASSRSVMGVYKISQFVEFLALIMFFGMLGLKIIFLVEMIFGNSDWVGSLRWNVGNSVSVSYVVLLITASISLCLMLWLAATPLKSASSRLDTQLLDWDIKNVVPDSSAERDDIDFKETRYDEVEPMLKQESAIAPGKSLESCANMSITTDMNLPETLLDCDKKPHLPTIEENSYRITSPSPSMFHPEESGTTDERDMVATVYSEGFVDTMALKTESSDLAEKNLSVEGVLRTGKDEEVENWEPQESCKVVSGSSPSLMSEGPRSYRSLSGKSDDNGSGAGSLSRLSGLGRAARRQLAVVLDEFWGQLFDFHGRVLQEEKGKGKKLDVLLRLDSTVDPKPVTPLKLDVSAKEFTGYFSSLGGRGSDSPTSSSPYDFPKMTGVQGGMETSFGIQRVPSSSWSSRMQLLDAYVQNSSHNAFDSGERRYSSLRLPPPSEGNDYQPATVHGYQIASYLSRVAKEKSYDYYLDGQMEALTPKSPSLGRSNYRDPPVLTSGLTPKSPLLGTSNYRDMSVLTSARKVQNGLSTMKPPGFPDPVVPRKLSLQSERPFNDLSSAGPAENLNTVVNAKKFHSLPDILGLSLPHQNSYLSGRRARWDSPIGYGPSLYASTSMKARAPLAFDDLSPSKPYRDPFTSHFTSSSETGSLWSRQPFEQFGVAVKTDNDVGVGVECNQRSVTPETTSVVDLEVKLLQSFRHCIIKLLKLEGSDWLFRQNDGADEDLIDRVAARERFLYEAETREMNRLVHTGDSQYSFDGKLGSVQKTDETDVAKFLVSSVPHCGEGCIWTVDLIISFGVWCIHRILELSLMESRPELWGKYTYVLNRLQGIMDPAFSKPRTPMTPCFCLQIPAAHQQRSSPPPILNGSLPPPVKQGRGKCTTPAMLLDTIKDVEIAISYRKGRSGTAAGDVAFPRGKGNLTSVLKRYKRRLSNKPVSNHEGTTGQQP
ncbi:EIN2-CEND like [Actinidia chinensis var. chinensis]|uniref:EIN2-CEND like n=1 Tax=Actinidia chinensis var. chinensis TaxID=1590841 RepID=A0A2R6PWM2_ACTCC|nr:EIN2-CEND like [Actinidia chinensis var. chinensis]